MLAEALLSRKVSRDHSNCAQQLAIVFPLWKDHPGSADGLERLAKCGSCSIKLSRGNVGMHALTRFKRVTVSGNKQSGYHHD